MNEHEAQWRHALNRWTRPLPNLAGRRHAACAPARHRDARRDVTGQNDRLLVQRLQSGDRQAFAQLLDAYETRVYRLALRFTGTVADAEDVTQEIFLGVYKSIGNFKGSSALGTWIYRIAMNHCLEFRRKRKLDIVPYDEELTLASHDWRENPEQSASKGELSSRVEAALQPSVAAAPRRYHIT